MVEHSGWLIVFIKACGHFCDTPFSSLQNSEFFCYEHPISFFAVLLSLTLVSLLLLYDLIILWFLLYLQWFGGCWSSVYSHPCFGQSWWLCVVVHHCVVSVCWGPHIVSLIAMFSLLVLLLHIDSVGSIDTTTMEMENRQLPLHHSVGGGGGNGHVQGEESSPTIQFALIGMSAEEKEPQS